MNKKTILHVKGIHTPRLIIWAKGFFHGKILHSGGLDLETKKLSSSFITGQINSYREACVVCRDQAEKKLASKWAEADQLLIDYVSVMSALELDKAENDQHSIDGIITSAQARAKQRAAEKRASLLADRQDILKAMAGIASDINSHYLTAHAQMEATAEALMSTFSAYGHGLLLKPVFPHSLPDLSFNDCSDQIILNHITTWDAMLKILEKEERN